MQILKVYGGGEILVKKTSSGQFSPIGEIKRVIELPVVPARLKGHLRNVAARVSFELNSMRPDVYSIVETDNPNLIEEGSWLDSLDKILAVKGVDRRTLPEIIANNFGARNLYPVEREQLVEDIRFVLDELIDSSRK
jgi:hypothetical protein